MAKYAKLRDGTWGIRVEGAAPAPAVGATIAVTTKSGTVKEERVRHVLFTGPDKYSGGTSSLCAIEPRSDSGGGSRRGGGRGRGAQYCEGWGADNPHPPKPPFTCMQCE